MTLSTFEERIGHRFSAPDLLEEALRHASAHGHGGEAKPSYERLEFLGDAVLNLCVAQELYRILPLAGEGVLTKARASIINNRNLAKIAERIGITELLRIDSSVRRKGGITRKMAADAVEALIGAIFLDSGHGAALRFVERHFRLPDLMGALVEGFDAKSRLQEWCQGEHLPLPSYSLLSADGPPHARFFRVQVLVQERPPAEGCGPSRKEAEMDAASKAISSLLGAGGETP